MVFPVLNINCLTIHQFSMLISVSAIDRMEKEVPATIVGTERIPGTPAGLQNAQILYYWQQ